MATGSLIKSIILYNICFFFAVSDCLQWNQVSLSFITASSTHRRTCSTSSKPFYHITIFDFFFLITSLVPNCLKLWMSEWNLLSHVQLFVAPWIIQSMEFSLGQNTGVGSLSFLQGIFPTQGSNPGLLHCRHILYQLSHKGSPSNSGELIYSDIDPVRRIIFHNCCFLYFLLCFIGVLFSSLYP